MKFEIRKFTISRAKNNKNKLKDLENDLSNYDKPPKIQQKLNLNLRKYMKNL